MEKEDTEFKEMTPISVTSLAPGVRGGAALLLMHCPGKGGSCLDILPGEAY